jgi:hypothetical protein
MSQQIQADMFTEREAQLSALDDLFQATKTFRTSHAYFKLLKFIGKFPRYKPFNCFLLHTQNSNISYIASSHQWQSRFGRCIKRDAHPLVILAPMGPVAFVYDLEDTEGEPFPPALANPFQTHGVLPDSAWSFTHINCKRDHIAILTRPFSRFKAGDVTTKQSGILVRVGGRELPAKRAISLNEKHTREEQYATLVHELAHIHCGHTGCDADGWWPDRQGLMHESREFEAESVSYLVCKRLNLETTAASYLAGYVEANAEIPEISIDRIIKVAGYVESLGQKELPTRRANDA